MNKTNMKCQRCNQKITMAYESQTDEEGVLIDIDYEAGHKADCRYYRVEEGGREWKDTIANAPMPTLDLKWTKEDEARRLAFRRENWR